MKRYAIIFEDSAQVDVRESYDWGRRTWGQARVTTVGSPIAQSGFGTTSRRAESVSLAPEDDEFSEEIRQMVNWFVSFCKTV